MSKISISAWKKYTTCPKLFDYHYNERLRPVGTSSALLFGTAIDLALNALLTKSADPYETFKESFEWEAMKDVIWDQYDYDSHIFSKEQLLKIAGESEDYKSWASMRIKGRMMIDTYKEKVLPLITKVYSVQKELDGRPGILDAVVELKGHGKVLLDHKTSARPYDRSAVLNDMQLALYAHNQNIELAGFVVLVKNVNKNLVKICKKCSFNGSFTKHHTCPQMVEGDRCRGAWQESTNPEIIVQVMVDKVPDLNKKLITDSINETEQLIQCGVFPRNLNACGKIYGKPCVYIDKCFKNSDTGLVIKKESK